MQICYTITCVFRYKIAFFNLVSIAGWAADPSWLNHQLKSAANDIIKALR